MLLPPPADHLMVSFPAIAGKACGHQIGAHRQAAFGFGNDVIKRLRRCVAVCAAMGPGLEDALPPAAAGDELNALDPRLHWLRAAAASLIGFDCVKVCYQSMAMRAGCWDDWLTRTETPRDPIHPSMNFIIRTAACLTMAIGITGATWWCLTTTLDDMTRQDCQAGVVRACQALKQ